LSTGGTKIAAVNVWFFLYNDEKPFNFKGFFQSGEFSVSRIELTEVTTCGNFFANFFHKIGDARISMIRLASYRVMRF